MDNLGLVPSQMVMIGDQLFTDVLSGNRLGVLTILVDPLTSTRFITGQFLRLFERPLLAWLKREGMLPSRLGSGS
jgi:predicted HAD superfamily phosphohydrolase YqeG